jgi:hypothetical protein
VLHIEGLFEQALSTFLLAHNALSVGFKAELHEDYFIKKKEDTKQCGFFEKNADYLLRRKEKRNYCKISIFPSFISWDWIALFVRCCIPLPIVKTEN